MADIVMECFQFMEHSLVLLKMEWGIRIVKKKVFFSIQCGDRSR